MLKDLFLDRVREVCQEVAEQADYVRIDKKRLSSYAASITDEELLPPRLDPETHFVGPHEEKAAFVIVLAAINYGSGYFADLKKYAGHSGYFMIAKALKDHFEKRSPFTSNELMRLSTDDCAKMFRQDRRNPIARQLMNNFSMSLNELGRYLDEVYNGSYVEMIESAEGSAERLSEILAAMSRFDDVAFYRDLDVAFYKRAQLAAADLWLALDGTGLGRFDDLERLTAFADNQVPHVLRLDGILRYASSLEETIDLGKTLAAQSAEEVEVRACTIHAVELLVEELRLKGREVRAMEVDYFLWNRGLRRAYRSPLPHRTRTIFY